MLAILITGYFLIKTRTVCYSSMPRRGKKRFPMLDKWLTESGHVSYRQYFILHGIFAAYILGSFLYQFMTLNFSGFNKTIMAMFILFVPFNLFIHITVIEFRKKVLSDLIRVHEILYWQSKIKVPEEKSLAFASELITGPLKQKIVELAACYRLRRDVSAKLTELRNLSPVEELQAFTYMLEEKYKTGMTEDYHKSSMSILKRLRKIERKLSKMANFQILFINGLILLGLFFIDVGVPLIYTAVNQFKIIIQ